MPPGLAAHSTPLVTCSFLFCDGLFFFFSDRIKTKKIISSVAGGSRLEARGGDGPAAGTCTLLGGVRPLRVQARRSRGSVSMEDMRHDAPGVWVCVAVVVPELQPSCIVEWED